MDFQYDMAVKNVKLAFRPPRQNAGRPYL